MTKGILTLVAMTLVTGSAFADAGRVLNATEGQVVAIELAQVVPSTSNNMKAILDTCKLRDQGQPASGFSDHIVMCEFQLPTGMQLMAAFAAKLSGSEITAVKFHYLENKQNPRRTQW